MKRLNLHTVGEILGVFLLPLCGCLDGNQAGVVTRERCVLRGQRDHVQGLNFDKNGKSLAAASADGTVKIWDMSTQREELSIVEKGNGPIAVLSVAYSPDSNMIAFGRSDGIVKLCSTTGHEIAVFQRDTEPVRSVAFSPDGEMLAAADSNILCIWELKTGKLRRQLVGHTKPIWSVTFLLTVIA